MGFRSRGTSLTWPKTYDLSPYSGASSSEATQPVCPLVSRMFRQFLPSAFVSPPMVSTTVPSASVRSTGADVDGRCRMLAPWPSVLATFMRTLATGLGELGGEIAVPVPGDGDAPTTGDPVRVGTMTGPATGVATDGSGRRSPKYAITMVNSRYATMTIRNSTPTSTSAVRYGAIAARNPPAVAPAVRVVRGDGAGSGALAGPRPATLAGRCGRNGEDDAGGGGPDSSSKGYGFPQSGHVR